MELRLWLLRGSFILVGVIGWFVSQSWIGRKGFPVGGIGDGLFDLFQPLHKWLVERPGMADTLLLVSSFVIDCLGLFLIAISIFGSSLRPFIGLLLLFALRQVCQGLCALPAPDAMIWRRPKFPSLFVTYGVSNDFFFSGHTAIAVLGAVELARTGSPWLMILGIVAALFEAITVLVLRAHYTMDVFTAIIAALLMAIVASWFAPVCDRTVARWASGGISLDLGLQSGAIRHLSEDRSPMSITLRSSAFTERHPIPVRHTEDGDDLSPPLTWTQPPKGTVELALIVDDPDAPVAEPWVHWVIYNIPVDATGLPEGYHETKLPIGAPDAAIQGKNTWGTTGYRGPAPPKGHGIHHYHFKLFALDAPLSLNTIPDKKALLDAMSGHVLARGELVGTYNR